MSNSKVLLLLAGVLIVIGLIKPDLGNLLPNNKPTDVAVVVVVPPDNEELREKCQLVIDALKNGSSERTRDGKRLSSLYLDLATLVELDGSEEVVKNTEDVRQANLLSGTMLRMNLKGKYPELVAAAQAVLVSQIQDDAVPLDKDLRQKTVEAFRALAWACNEGSK